MLRRLLPLTAILIFSLMSVGCCFVPICSVGPEDMASIQTTEVDPMIGEPEIERISVD